MTKVSIVIPARDEQETLDDVLGDVFKTIARIPDHEFEVICVDDHSKDRTPEIIRAHGATLVQNTGNSGKGLALRAGFAHATGEIIVMMDADYSHRAEDLPVFLEAFRDDIGLVIGSRVWGGSEEYTHVRALGNVFLSTMLGLCTRRYLSDALNGYKAFRRDVFSDFTYTAKAFEIEIELIANALRRGYRVVEVSSRERARAGGEMKSSVVRHGTRFLARIFWEGFKGVNPPTAKTDSTEPPKPGA